MADLKSAGTTVEVRAVLTINESELRALDALIGYGIESFLKAFYERLGRHYMEPHEAGMRSFFAAIRGCKGMAEEAEECRQFLAESHDARIKALRNAREDRRADGTGKRGGE